MSEPDVSAADGTQPRHHAGSDDALHRAGIDDALRARLRSVAVLSDVSDAEIARLGEGRVIRVGRGELLARQGEPAQHFWILLAGELHIVQVMPDGREQAIAVLPAGTAFGELPLLANIPTAHNVTASADSELLEFDEQQFWGLMTACPGVRKAVLGNMAARFQKFQSALVQQERMASLGALAAGLMHELNNPGAAAVRAAAQLRENLGRMQQLTAKFSRSTLSEEQKACMYELQEYALSKPRPLQMNSIEQSDAEEALTCWMDAARVEDAWKLAPTLVSIGITRDELECARAEFPGKTFSDALNWLEALVSSMALVTTIEESIGRVSTLVKAVKSYAYEGKGQKQTIDVNESIYATLLILGHKLREKQIVLEKKLDKTMAPLQCECSGLNQIWTNLLDNAIDALGTGGHIRIRTWEEDAGGRGRFVCVAIGDDGPGIPLESQPHIFDAFYTTKAPGVGTGLGLGIVQRITEQYGGSVSFASAPGDTEFRIRLPRERVAGGRPA